MMRKVAYYKGCVAGLSAKELDVSTRRWRRSSDSSWSSWSRSPAAAPATSRRPSPTTHLHLNARILAEAEHAGCDTLLTICNVCTLNLRQATWQLEDDETLRSRVNENLEQVGVAAPTSGDVEVTHLLWLIARRRGARAAAEVAATRA